MNILTRALTLLLAMLLLTVPSVAQFPENFEDAFPPIAQALRAGNQAALRDELGKLSDHDKQRVLTVLHSQRLKSGGELPSSNPPLPQNPSSPTGGAGGGAIANFSELMNLIETTITPDVWLNAGGNATMSPFRQGVRITTDGVIERIATVKQNGAPKLRAIPGELAKEEPIAVALDDLGDWQKPSELRWVSLKTLDRQLHAQIEQSSASNIASELMGGLCRIDYLAWDSINEDWLIGGPAGNLAASRQGELLHREHKLPPVLLEDLLTVSHHVLHSKGEFGCSIDPDPERLIAAYQMANDKSSVRLLARDPEAWVSQWKKQLGFQKANVVGIPQDSPTGYALLIADAHMKRLAFGLEPSVQGLANYWNESERLGYAKEQSMVRWWFAMSQTGISYDPDEKIYRFQGSNVCVLSETQMMGADGTRVVAQLPDRAADAFAKNFTSKFDALQRSYPIYGRLRHVFDLAVVMEIVRAHNAQATGQDSPRVEFNVLGKQQFVPRMQIAPTQIESIVATRKRSDGSVSAIVSGGVSIEPSMVRSKLRLDRQLSKLLSVESSPGQASDIGSTEALEQPFWK